VILLCNCGFVSSEKGVEHHAFIDYFPPAKGDTRLRLAVKDNIDMKGHVSTAGSEYLYRHGKPATKDAPCLAIARQRKDVVIVGKANLSEFAVSPSGYNEYFGTPRSPLKRMPKLIPGGSSCGSAVAVARGYADVAFGTDTAGSVRVPAACCGVVGLKTTKGLIPIEGVHPIEPEHLDTVGPLSWDIEHSVKGMDLLVNGFAAKYQSAVAAKPFASGIRVGRLRLEGTDRAVDRAVDDALSKTGFQVVDLGKDLSKKFEEAREDGNTVAAAGAWMSDKEYLYKFEIAPRTKSILRVGHFAYSFKYRDALARQAAWQHALEEVFKKVDFIALPTLQNAPPRIPINLRVGLLELTMLKLQNTVPVNYAGNPALALPISLNHQSVYLTSLELIGPKNSEAALLNAGRLVEAAVPIKRPAPRPDA
jgi:amidase